MRLLDFIIADDVRQELGNKTSIMGVYGEEIILSPPPPSWPIPLRIAVYIRVSPENADVMPDKFSLQISQSGNKIAHMRGNIAVAEKGKSFVVPLVIFPLPIPGPGLIQFDFVLTFKDEKLVESSNTLNVKVA
jgi:hypothetical protein